MRPASPLLEAALAIAQGSKGGAVEQDGGRVSVIYESEKALIIEQSGEGVLLSVRAWLGLHPRTSGKLTRLPSDDADWEVVYTESEWHTRGLVAAVMDKLSRRSTLEGRLVAGLAGNLEGAPVGRDSGDYWKALAEWGKKTERLTPADRHFAFLYGQKLERRVTPSEKFRAWAIRTANIAEGDGFQPPER